MSRLLALFGGLAGPRAPALSSAISWGLASSLGSGPTTISPTSAAVRQLRSQRTADTLLLYGNLKSSVPRLIVAPAVAVSSHHALAAAKYIFAAQCGTYTAATSSQFPSVPKEGAAKAGAAKAPKDGADPDVFVDMLLGVVSPLLRKVSFAGFLGFCVGTTIRKVGELIAQIIGGVFIFLQMLAWRGYITIHWSKLKEDLDRIFCRAKDTEADTRSMLRWALEVLVYNVPNAGGFYYGLYYGLVGLRG